MDDARKITTIRLPPEMHRSLKYLAIERLTSMNRLVVEAVEKLIKEDK